MRWDEMRWAVVQDWLWRMLDQLELPVCSCHCDCTVLPLHTVPSYGCAVTSRTTTALYSVQSTINGQFMYQSTYGGPAVDADVPVNGSFAITLFIVGLNTIDITHLVNFSERELTITFAICCRPSVCLSSVTLVHPTQPVEIFGNVSTPFGTLAIRWHARKILRRSSKGNLSIRRGGG